MIGLDSAVFSAAQNKSRMTIFAVIASITLAFSTLFVLAPKAGAAQVVYASTYYSTMSACQAGQRSAGHSSSITITTPCRAVAYFGTTIYIYNYRYV
jgi:hypothetical protein